MTRGCIIDNSSIPILEMYLMLLNIPSLGRFENDGSESMNDGLKMSFIVCRE